MTSQLLFQSDHVCAVAGDELEQGQQEGICIKAPQQVLRIASWLPRTQFMSPLMAIVFMDHGHQAEEHLEMVRASASRP